MLKQNLKAHKQYKLQLKQNTETAERLRCHSSFPLRIKKAEFIRLKTLMRSGLRRHERNLEDVSLHSLSTRALKLMLELEADLTLS